MKKIFLIFPNQLFKIKNQFTNIKHIALIQDSLFFGCDPQWHQKFHCQKIIFHKVTMDTYEENLKRYGFNVIYIKHERDKKTEEHLNYIAKKGFNYFITYEAFDWTLEKRINDFSRRNNIKLEIRKNHMFLTNTNISDKILNQKKKLWDAAIL